MTTDIATPVKPFTPSAPQRRFFDEVEHGAGNIILDAVAGSGKTTTITRALPLIPESMEVKILAFNALIATELNQRIQGLRDETGRRFENFRACTFHSLGFGVVRKRLASAGTVVNVDKDKATKLIRAVVKSEEELESYGMFVEGLLHLAKAEGVGTCIRVDTIDAYADIIAHHGMWLPDEKATEERAIELARAALTMSDAWSKLGQIDFDDQLYLPIKWNLRLWRVDWLMIDEAQDTNAVRRELALMALKPSGRLVAVGDPMQAIYGFTGASHDSIDLLRDAFAAKTMPLSVCYRCSKNVVESAAEIVPHIEAAPNAIQGGVERNVPLRVAAKVLGPRDAILCRNVAPLVQVAYGLIGAGIGCHVLGREIGAGLTKLVAKMKARTIPELEERLAMFADREAAKFIEKGQEMRAEGVRDRVACITTCIDNLPETERTVARLVKRMTEMFADQSGVLTLSSIHKAKGREWRRVAILRPELMPSKAAKLDWQMKQETNLDYVARTRAMEHLMFILPGDISMNEGGLK